MVTVTQQAVEALHDALTASGQAGENALRLAAAQSGYQLQIDEPAEEDRVVWFQENPVLLIDPAVEQALSDAVIELVDGDDGQGLKLVIRTGQ